LEISFDGGNTFHDILAAGGSFVMGGYNRTISTDRGSPVAGRQAWSGNSEGFILTVVNLPFMPTGGKLRWRIATITVDPEKAGALTRLILLGAAPVRVVNRLLCLAYAGTSPRPVHTAKPSCDGGVYSGTSTKPVIADEAEAPGTS
jgi:hypothetical protein